MSAPEKTIDGAAWAKALPAARKRRKGAGKRIAEAIECADNRGCAIQLHGVRRLGRANYACAKCGRDASILVVLLHEAGCDVEVKP